MTKLYKTYLFKDKDPIIDKLRTIIKDANIDIKELGNSCGVKETTLYSWLYGMTKRPQHASLKAVFNVLGCEWEPRKRRISK